MRVCFNVAVGRYHTAIGYYNNAYHHGKWLQTAAERPHIYDFEDSGGLLPIHNVGVSVSGAITPDFEWLNEGVLVRDASDRGTFTTFGFYTQIARRFGLFRPCVRYEYLSESARDPIVLLAGRPGRAQLLSLGVRYDFSELAALKLQWERAFVGRDDGARNELTLQLSFTF